MEWKVQVSMSVAHGVAMGEGARAAGGAEGILRATAYQWMHVVCAVATIPVAAAAMACRFQGSYLMHVASAEPTAHPALGVMALSIAGKTPIGAGSVTGKMPR